MNVDKFVSELQPEYAMEYVWSPKDADAAREIGADAFAEWLEMYALNIGRALATEGKYASKSEWRKLRFKGKVLGQE